MGRHGFQNPSQESAGFDRAMGRNGHVMCAIQLGCETEMGSSLSNGLVSQNF